ncbi:integrin alpha-5-like isoform X2 [Panulirus ornatus]|uniref:integrin alpha-5-like isoform X2 n=1 Tax=Panulirus ornatus TaxID=150431 RepID=UPI003A8A1CE2
MGQEAVSVRPSATHILRPHLSLRSRDDRTRRRCHAESIVEVVTAMVVMVKMMMVVMVVIATGLGQVCGFNLNVGLARVLEGPSGTNYGYSVALWTDSFGAKRLVVGAPRGRNTSAGNYTLPLGNLHLCEAFSTECPSQPDLPTLSVADSSAGTVSWSEAIIKQGIGFAEAMYTTDHVPSSLVVCAPRYSIAVPEPSLQPRGACYVLRDATTSQARKIVPFRGICYVVNGSCHYNGNKFTGFAMAGYSVAFSQNQRHLFMGGPYAFYGQGTVARSGSGGERRAGQVLTKTYFGGSVLDFSSEGWAMAVGRFDGESNMVAVSVPNSLILVGTVRFYTEDLKQVPDLEKQGSDVGAKYGFSLAAGDLDGDGVTDLVVGAPLAPGARGAPDAGKVYVYYAPGKKVAPRISPLLLEGQVNWGHFGQAVTSPGDLNLDGYDDCVVGAPQEEGGAVYVFSGGPDGLLPHPTQRIHASDFSPDLRGFGFSLDGGQDMDNNGYPDLIIGAPSSDTAIFLRSAPVLSLEGSVVFEPPIIILGKKTCSISPMGEMTQDVVCFDLVVSLQYTALNYSVPLEMDLDLQLDQVEGRLAFLDDYQSSLVGRRNVTTSREPSHPWRIPVYVKPGRHQSDMPLTATVKVSLQPSVQPLEDPADGHNGGGHLSLPELPRVLNILDETSFSAHARLTCDNTSTCFSRPDLFLRAQPPSELVIGSGTLEVQVELFVLNDTAYSTQLAVTYPPTMIFWQVTGDNYLPNCKANHGGDPDLHSHVCWFTSDLHKNEQILLTFHFQYVPEILMDHFLTSGNSELNLLFNASSESVDLDERDNSVNLTIPTMAQIDLHLIGSSFPTVVEGRVKELAGLAELANPGELASPQLLGPKVSLVFSLTNHGPSTLMGAKMVLRLPLFLSNGGLPLLYLLEPLDTSRGVICTVPTLNPRGFNFSSNEDGREDVPEDVHTSEGDGWEDIPKPPLTWDIPTTTLDLLTDSDPTSGEPAVVTVSQGIPLETSRRRRRRVTDAWSPSGSTVEPVPPSDSTTEPVPYPFPLPTAMDGATDEDVADNVTNGVKKRGKKEVTLACDTVHCEEVMCDVSTLEVGRAATVTVYGYVVFATLKYTLPLGITWWHWLLVLVISIFSILIMMAILYKVGFFKRNRPPSTEQLSMAPEAQEDINEEL